MAPGRLASTQVYTLRVVLRGISPLVWRRLLVRADSTIADLHDVLQLAFGWGDEHLNRFFIHGREYGVEHEGAIWFRRPGHEVVLCELGLRAPERFTYEYDLGDGWLHDVHLEASRTLDPSRSYPVCIGGRRAAPPEDCGGPAGFMESRWRYRLQARCSPAEFEEIGELLQLDEDDEEYPATARRYDPERFDQREVNRLLSKWTASRREGRLG